MSDCQNQPIRSLQNSKKFTKKGKKHDLTTFFKHNLLHVEQLIKNIFHFQPLVSMQFIHAFTLLQRILNGPNKGKLETTYINVGHKALHYLHHFEMRWSFTTFFKNKRPMLDDKIKYFWNR